MSTFGSIVLGLGNIVVMLISVYTWVIIIAALLTWVRPDPNNPVVQILYRLSEPAYYWIRRYIPTVFNGIDLAPLILIIGLQVLQVLVSNLITAVATSL